MVCMDSQEKDRRREMLVAVQAPRHPNEVFRREPVVEEGRKNLCMHVYTCLSKKVHAHVCAPTCGRQPQVSSAGKPPRQIPLRQSLSWPGAHQLD